MLKYNLVLLLKTICSVKLPSLILYVPCVGIEIQNILFSSEIIFSKETKYLHVTFFLIDLFSWELPVVQLNPVLCAGGTGMSTFMNKSLRREEI